MSDIARMPLSFAAISLIQEEAMSDAAGVSETFSKG